MSAVRFRMYRVPAAVFTRHADLPPAWGIVQDLVSELETLERRLDHSAQAEQDQQRYGAATALLTQAVRRVAALETLHTADVGPELLLRVGEEPRLRVAMGPSELGACLQTLRNVSPDEVTPAVTLVNEAQAANDGIVIEQWLAPGAGVTRRLAAAPTSPLRAPRPPNAIRNEMGRIDPERTLAALVAWALECGESINVNRFNHVVFTRVLAGCVASRPDRRPSRLRIAYGDGTEAEEMPVFAVGAANPDKPEIELRVALMSMRHLQLDRHVAVNWLRNREIVQDRGLAGSDRYCTARSREQLAQLRSWLPPETRLRLHVYHTGFEPAVVAIYRAITETLLDGSDWIRAVPFFFGRDDSGFEEGPSWPTAGEV